MSPFILASSLSRVVNLPGNMSNRSTNEATEPLGIGLPNIRIPAVPEKPRDEMGQEKKPAKILVPELPNGGAFHDLRISALLKDRCSVTQNGLVRIQLELSEHPPLGWSYIF